MRKLLNILVVMGTAMAIAACGNSSSNELKDGKAVAVPEANEVEVVTLERTDFAHQLLSNGKLKAGRRASLSFGSSGIVSELNVSNGGIVSAGSVIAELDRPDLKLSLEATQIALEKADLELYGCGMEICPNETLCQITSNNACVRYSFLTPSAD